MSKCIGCGITLQTDYPDELGYTNKITSKYCARCFKTINYNAEIKVKGPDNLKIIKKINKMGLYTIFITDLLSINKSLIDIFHMIKNDKILIINKCDIIPDNLKLEYLEENIRRIYNIKDVKFISAKKKLYLDSIVSLIELHKDVIICGETSSGKSTLINNLVNSNLTTSKYSNTTLDFIKIKSGVYTLYDTPGLIVSNTFSYDKINVLIKKLSKEFTITINDLKLRGSGNITCFFKENVSISSKKEGIALKNEYIIDKPKDIIISGNGFIFVKGNAQIITNKDLEIRDSIIK